MGTTFEEKRILKFVNKHPYNQKTNREEKVACYFVFHLV